MEWILRGLISAISWFIGVLLPFTGLTIFGGSVNLIWNSIYGLGYYFSYFLFGSIRGTLAGPMGFLFWPLLIAGLVFWLSGVALRIKSLATKVVIGLLVVVSIFLNITIQRAKEAPYLGFPFFYTQSAVSY